MYRVKIKFSNYIGNGIDKTFTRSNKFGIETAFLRSFSTIKFLFFLFCYTASLVCFLSKSKFFFSNLKKIASTNAWWARSRKSIKIVCAESEHKILQDTPSSLPPTNLRFRAGIPTCGVIWAGAQRRKIFTIFRVPGCNSNLRCCPRV